jgi:hypothetical protein
LHVCVSAARSGGTEERAEGRKQRLRTKSRGQRAESRQYQLLPCLCVCREVQGQCAARSQQLLHYLRFESRVQLAEKRAERGERREEGK